MVTGTCYVAARPVKAALPIRHKEKKNGVWAEQSGDHPPTPRPVKKAAAGAFSNCGRGTDCLRRGVGLELGPEARVRRRRDRLKRSCVPTFVCSSEGTNPAITAYPATGRLP